MARRTLHAQALPCVDRRLYDIRREILGSLASSGAADSVPRGFMSGIAANGISADGQASTGDKGRAVGQMEEAAFRRLSELRPRVAVWLLDFRPWGAEGTKRFLNGSQGLSQLLIGIQRGLSAARASPATAHTEHVVFVWNPEFCVSEWPVQQLQDTLAEATAPSERAG